MAACVRQHADHENRLELRRERWSRIALGWMKHPLIQQYAELERERISTTPNFARDLRAEATRPSTHRTRPKSAIASTAVPQHEVDARQPAPGPLEDDHVDRPGVDGAVSGWELEELRSGIVRTPGLGSSGLQTRALKRRDRLKAGLADTSIDARAERSP